MFEPHENPELDQKLDVKPEDFKTPEWSDTIDFEPPSETPVKTKRHKKGTCRCCLSEGKFETMELRTKHEPTLSYIDMLRTVLGLKLQKFNGSRLICDACATRLQQALTFRRQVAAAENAFILRMEQVKLEEDLIKVKTEQELHENSVEDEETPYQSDLVDALNILKAKEVKIEFSEVGIDEFDYPDMPDSPKAPKRKYVKKNGAVPCQFCRQKFNTEEEKREHKISKHLTCPRCKRVFETPGKRDLHLKLHPVQCQVCDKIFEAAHLKNRHLLNVHGHKCSKCNERVRPHQWYQHNYEMHGMTSTQCRICDKICRGINALHRHQRMEHMREKNVQCQECGFMTFDERTLKRHMVSHSTEKKYTCDYCNKKFIRKSTMTTHVMIHSGHKTKVCKLCGEAFVQRASLKYHLEKYHPGDYY